MSTSPCLFNVKNFFVVVSSVNDNPPIFDRSIYQRSVAESEPLDQVLLQIHAKDRDEGENARLSYSIDDSTSTFRINEHTGEIYLIKSLDYEKIRSYSISITGQFFLFLLVSRIDWCLSSSRSWDTTAE